MEETAGSTLTSRILMERIQEESLIYIDPICFV